MVARAVDARLLRATRVPGTVRSTATRAAKQREISHLCGLSSYWELNFLWSFALHFSVNMRNQSRTRIRWCQALRREKKNKKQEENGKAGWEGRRSSILSGTDREDFTKIIFESRRQRRLFGCAHSALLGPAQRSFWGKVRGGEDEMKIR